MRIVFDVISDDIPALLRELADDMEDGKINGTYPDWCRSFPRNKSEGIYRYVLIKNENHPITSTIDDVMIASIKEAVDKTFPLAKK